LRGLAAMLEQKSRIMIESLNPGLMTPELAYASMGLVEVPT
jgi:hypothetical protein